jgi:hypothetical protein
MTTNSLEQAITCSEEILLLFKETGTELTDTPGKKFPFIDYEFTSRRYRKAHLSIVDARETNKLWFMHCCVFPHANDPSPIFGFDIICGPSRVSGAFLDLSNAGDPTHYTMRSFNRRVESMNWKKERELPDWAKSIFSPAMVAIGSVDEEELEKFIKLGMDTLYMYIAEVGNTQQDVASFEGAQNFYCQQQKKNPHTPRVMASLGLTPEQVKEFSHTVLFPEL